jgi:hypothetical protein
MLRDFLAHLHRGGQYAYYHALPQRRSAWYAVADGPPAIDLGGVRDANLYFSVHPSTRIPPCNAHGEVKAPAYVRGQTATLAAVNCLYAEFDAKDYGDKPAILTHLDGLIVPTPSALVDSGGGVHAYWLLDTPYPLDTPERLAAARHIQSAWVALVGGDKGAHDLTRILRIPGTHNLKYDPPRPVAWLRAWAGDTYPLRALTAHLPPVQGEAPRAPKALAPTGARAIDDYNSRQSVRALLEARGYRERGRHRMVSPYSGSGRDGAVVDEERNRAYVHTGGDPLADGYWKRPFDVVRILDFGGDFQRTLGALREGKL